MGKFDITLKRLSDEFTVDYARFALGWKASSGRKAPGRWPGARSAADPSWVWHHPDALDNF
ncbi:MAG: hypothetical protein QME81_06235 [bacterium]|nr:hypothetical protein [bacterium]